MKNIPLLVLLMVFSAAFLRSYVRIQTTLTGYDLGNLKDKESHLLEQRSRLQMELAKISDRDHLMLLSHGHSQDQKGEFVAAKTTL
jgi:hypothetical protein